MTNTRETDSPPSSNGVLGTHVAPVAINRSDDLRRHFCYFAEWKYDADIAAAIKTAGEYATANNIDRHQHDVAL
jgi:hypothetical protein